MAICDRSRAMIIWANMAAISAARTRAITAAAVATVPVCLIRSPRVWFANSDIWIV